jgi:hypothetical protein
VWDEDAVSIPSITEKQEVFVSLFMGHWDR